mmetsp:Transcript_20779/g.64924  ORF Transcript_20779/g.64924 Transcript_20779/m.64924 type:complete len:305 (+) Transcript_20779:460-1374(+)
MFALVSVRVQDVLPARQVVLESRPVRPRAAGEVKGRDVQVQPAGVVHQGGDAPRDVEEHAQVLVTPSPDHLPEPAIGHASRREAPLAGVLLVAALDAALAARLPRDEAVDLRPGEKVVGQVHVPAAEARGSRARPRPAASSARQQQRPERALGEQLLRAPLEAVGEVPKASGYRQRQHLRALSVGLLEGLIPRGEQREALRHAVAQPPNGHFEVQGPARVSEPWASPDHRKGYAPREARQRAGPPDPALLRGKADAQRGGGHSEWLPPPPRQQQAPQGGVDEQDHFAAPNLRGLIRPCPRAPLH